jgi:hypothetical protein
MLQLWGLSSVGAQLQLREFWVGWGKGLCMKARGRQVELTLWWPGGEGLPLRAVVPFKEKVL